MASTRVERTQVLIAGCGPAGMAHAIELGRRGVHCLVVERNDRVGYAPRAKTTHRRTREHLRRWGIADRLRDASPLGVDYPSDVVFATRLNGHELARFANAFGCAPELDERYSEHAQWIPQYTLEEVLREYAESLPSVRILFQHELLDFTQDEAGVASRVRDLRTGTDSAVTSQFLVGADGARSRVRDLIGARMQGRYGLSRNYNVVFHAPGLAQANPLGKAVMYWLVNEEMPALVGPMDRGDRWFFMPTGVGPDTKLSHDEVPALIRRATGIDLPYEVLSSDEWVASQFIADRYRDARVFLIGDACHLHPPFGGYGMNMGFGDGVDLGWKLAAVLQGWGGQALLDSYEAERRPVHQYVIDEAVANHKVLANQLSRTGIEATGADGEQLRRQVGEEIRTTKAREFHAPGVVKGYCYAQSPVIAPEDGEPPRADWREYRPSAHPGCVAPHAWLADGSSLYDHFGEGITLLYCGPADDELTERFVAAAQRLGVPLAVLSTPHPDLAARYGARYALIRPDQHVAWRGDAVDGDATDLLAHLVGKSQAQAGARPVASHALS